MVAASTSADVVQKRLIISGLCPSITHQDVASRFAPFGLVKATDGVGLVDGNGDPRKFAFVTLETTELKLTKCMNLLNGTKWKGSKLRIGVARPDYMQRDDDSTPSELEKHKTKKRKRLAKGVDGKEAPDMSLTTLDNVDSRRAWNRTPLDHLVRPLRLRPDRPLPLVISTLSTKVESDKPARLKRDKNSLSKSRRTIIDPTRYGAVHLTASSGLLGSEVAGYEPSTENHREGTFRDERSRTPESSSSESSSSEAESPPPASSPAPKAQASTSLTTSGRELENEDNIRQERDRELDILSSLLGDKETLAWEPDSDLEELAWRNSDKRRAELEAEEEETQESSSESAGDETKGAAESHSPRPGTSMVSLKEMFAPRPDEAAFSLFANLGDNADLELEDAEEVPSAQPIDHSESQFPSAFTSSEVNFDPSAVFFFPLPRDEHGLVDLPGRGPRPRDFIDVLKTSPGDNFWRSQTEEELRKEWDELKGDLTKEYKQRHRAAVRRKKPQGQSSEGN